ncbi:DUF4105 domain-containing protein [Desulfuromonas sp. AOP6]|uniref:Lnb N-terminal periplasmic domain-containing protein n=1 Tax=Desulfuromonas sp. AOP6 TaxID=1566351 RepID=UPI00128564EE|nr:DUF4105 domain-containing protein [Desulfuromonas sp. AOP6]BCA81139.1 hypothetical protein AOP6_2926 [Desulfuromonas sp. AOP6]
MRFAFHDTVQAPEKGGLGIFILPGLALFLCLIFIGSAVQAAEISAERLRERARQQQLHQDPYWLTLLHYRPSLRGLGSLIDDPDFFVADNGKWDAQAELDATLQAFFAPPSIDQSPARCRFPARYEWLKEQLGAEDDDFPAATCSELDEAIAQVDPRSAVLIFPGTHNNSPASMFGHTLIIIEGPYKSRLLSYAVNYSAFTDETNGFAYAVKGIFGLYRGYFSVLPYYQKLREYRDLERRDVWEYPLDLDEDETRRMFLHIWELKDIYSDYFFFDENCAYQLLFLLEAARPGLTLIDHTRPWVIPIDTVRIVREEGLIEASLYRPSKATRIARIAAQMSDEEQKTTLSLLDGSIAPTELAEAGLNQAAQIRALDLATESVEFSYFKKQLGQDEYRSRYIALLTARSKLGPASPEPDWQEPVRPDRGHGSNRFSLGTGFRADDYYLQAKIRPAYHNLLDADAGYIAGSQIDFADLVLRYYPEDNRLRLHNLNLIEIVSLSPRSRFFKPISWKVKTGLIQRPADDGGDHLVYELSPGGGFSYGNDAVLGYGMVETELLVSGHFRDSFALGGGGSLGVLVNLADRWKVHAAARHIWHEAGDPHRSAEARLDQTLVTGRSSSLTLNLSRQKVHGRYLTDAGLNWNFFW